MAKSRNLRSEVAASFGLAWLAIFTWHVLLPMFNWVERMLMRPGPWGELGGILFISGSYYGLLCIILAIAERKKAAIHPISTAYFGGWWLIVLLAILSSFSPSYNNILGMSVMTSGANLVFITLFVGALKFWADGYLRPPPRPAEGGPPQELTDD